MATTHRGLLSVLGLVIIALAALAAWLVAVPLPVVITGSVVALVVLVAWLARQRKRERVTPVTNQPGKHG